MCFPRTGLLRERRLEALKQRVLVLVFRYVVEQLVGQIRQGSVLDFRNGYA